MKVTPIPLGITEQVIRYGCLPENCRWLLIFETKTEAESVKEFLEKSIQSILGNEDGYKTAL